MVPITAIFMFKHNYLRSGSGLSIGVAYQDGGDWISLWEVTPTGDIDPGPAGKTRPLRQRPRALVLALPAPPLRPVLAALAQLAARILELETLY